MQYDVATPKQYFEALEPDWRKQKLLEIRQLLLVVAEAAQAKVEEVINYKMLGYELNGNIFCHLNAQKGSVNFYVGDILKIDPSGTLLAGLNVGKGCIRFSKTKKTDSKEFKEFIVKLVESAKAGADLDC